MFSSRSRILIIIIVIVLFGVAIYLSRFYNQLGGSAEISVTQTDGAHYEIFGKNYTGTYNSREMEELFFTMKELVENQVSEGTLAIVSYLSDSIDEEEVTYFVGLITHDEEPLPHDFKRLVIDEKGFLQVKLNMHNSVMPLPSQIEEEMKVYAEENKMMLKDFTVEKYYQEDSLIIERPYILTAAIQ